MKKLIIAIAVCITEIGFSQENQLYLNIEDDWLQMHKNKSLKVGDTMLDISLGKVINNSTGKHRFADFRGKLLILDFWTTGCSICFEEFPYMEKLQQEFGDKIQILLANPVETQQQIEEGLGRGNKRVLPDLPSIVADEKFANLGLRIYDSSFLFNIFPFRNVPHHVWIDATGVIRVIGGHENTYAEKIRDLLEGRQISYLSSSAAVPDLAVDRNKPYYKQLGSLKNTPLSCGSFITPYNNEIVGVTDHTIDSSNGIYTEYFINQDLLTIYQRGPSIKRILRQNSIILYTPFSIFDDLVIFPEQADISKISSSKSRLGRRPTDKDYLKSKYCYELVVPLQLPDDTRRQYMLEDLNRFTGSHLGLVASFEKVNLPCYIIVRTSEKDKVGLPPKTFQSNFTGKVGTKKTIVYETASPFVSVIDWTVRRNRDLQAFMEQHKKAGKPFIIINGTGWSREKMTNMSLPATGLCTIDDLKAALSPFDLDIVESLQELESLVFKKIK